MNRPIFARAVGLLFALLLVLGEAQAVMADTSIGGTNVWTMVGAPSAGATGFGPFARVSFSNHLSVNVQGIVIMVLRNISGQTVFFSTATATIAPGAIASADLVEFGLAPGTYNATFFAFAFDGVPISLPTSSLFAVPG
ncbi:MAG TPA: hypothetical protein VGS04_02905 [Nitrososphaerales archaeon]|nr:hypothetical protein [Nitrososphaerales archaeon]